jgi:hypothetical protein
VATLSLVLWPEKYLTEYNELLRISQELSAKTLSELYNLGKRMVPRPVSLVEVAFEMVKRGSRKPPFSAAIPIPVCILRSELKVKITGIIQWSGIHAKERPCPPAAQAGDG